MRTKTRKDRNKSNALGSRRSVKRNEATQTKASG
jgi:hypothetical protein